MSSEVPSDALSPSPSQERQSIKTLSQKQVNFETLVKIRWQLYGTGLLHWVT